MEAAFNISRRRDMLIVLNHTRVLTSIVAVYHDVGFDFRCCPGYGSLSLSLALPRRVSLSLPGVLILVFGVLPAASWRILCELATTLKSI